MRLWPSVPLQINALASRDWDRSTTNSGTLVAGDIALSVGRWRNEAVVLVVGVPASGVWLGLGVCPGWGGALVVFTVGDDAGDVAVGGDEGDGAESCCESGDVGEGRHFCWSGSGWW